MQKLGTRELRLQLRESKARPQREFSCTTQGREAYPGEEPADPQLDWFAPPKQPWVPMPAELQGAGLRMLAGIRAHPIKFRIGLPAGEGRRAEIPPREEFSPGHVPGCPGHFFPSPPKRQMQRSQPPPHA